MLACLAEPQKFALAGKAVFTIVSKATGARFTYRVKLAPPRYCWKNKDPVHFVSVLTGADNMSSYTYLGTIRGSAFAHGKKSRIGEDAPSAKAFAWFWRHLMTGDALASLNVHHEGKCGRCGRALTVPSSIASGFGPECIKLV